MTDKPKHPGGRPPKAPEDRAEQVSIRLTPAEKEKFKQLGGNDWLRRAIARAKPSPR